MHGQRRCGIWNISDPGPATVYPAVRLWHQSEDFIKVHVHRARQWANSNTSRKSYCGATHRKAWWTSYRETETSWWHGHCCFVWVRRWESHVPSKHVCMHACVLPVETCFCLYKSMWNSLIFYPVILLWIGIVRVFVGRFVFENSFIIKQGFSNLNWMQCRINS